MMTGAEIVEVAGGSLAHELGLASGDRILQINGHRVADLIQLQFEWAGEQVFLTVEKADGSIQEIEVEKDYDQPLGAVFSRAVFDGIKPCANKCLFCFVDQMPAGMRSTLYIKDDDYRLSFLQGSYVTLTNLKPKDLRRIKREHLSPLYVSVHTTTPGLRVEMLKNKEAGRILEIMEDLARSGIEFHTQVVLCPGVNDGEALERTYLDLKNIPGVLSLAVVPVGLTTHREKLASLEGVSAGLAGQLVEWVREKQQECLNQRGSRFVWLSDEFYLLAGKDIPGDEVYEDYPQLENGVGMVRLLWDEFFGLPLPKEVRPRTVTIVTGISGRMVLEPLVARLNRIKGLQVKLLGLSNAFFGPTVTVAGLLTGSCLLEGLQGLAKGSTVLFPEVMLKDGEDRFLDELKPAELAAQLGIELVPVPVKAQALVEKILS